MKKIACFGGKAFIFLLSYAFIFFLATCSDPQEKNISIVSEWNESDRINFLEVAHAAGVNVIFRSTQNINSLIDMQPESADTPDIAILPDSIMLKKLSARNKIVPLYYLDPHNLLKDYARVWVELGSYSGKLYGIFFRATNKSLIWYNPQEFKKNSWNIPKTWNDLLILTKRMAMSGKTTWAIDADTGQSLSGWLANIMLKTAGPDTYEDWIEHKIPWTHANIKNAFLELKKIVGNSTYLYGGINGALSVTPLDALHAVFNDPPKAYMYYGDDTAGRTITNIYPNLTPGRDIAFFPFPEINPEYGLSVVGGADVFVAFKDTPSVRKLMTFLATKEAHEIRVKRGRFLSQNRNVPFGFYPDPMLMSSAAIITNAEFDTFNASDVLPPAFGKSRGFQGACKKFLQNPDDLDAILTDMELLARQYY